MLMVQWMFILVRKSPEGMEKNWVPTNPEKGFFLVFRFYGPTEGFIDKRWVLNDLELLK